MKVISVNLNGIRSAQRKGFFDWLATTDGDFICLQELKAQEADMTEEMLSPAGYEGYFHYAEKKGYSGVGIYTKQTPEAVHIGLDFPSIATEGRYIQVDFPELSVVSIYMPSGSSGEERQSVKFACMDHMTAHMQSLMNANRECILCGDWNIVHKEIDIKNWRGNQKNSGCLPEERAWLDMLFDEMGWVDAFRVVNQDAAQYTWWSNRGQAYANNVGWRLDYQIITPGLQARVESTAIYKDEKFSDHAPLIMTYK